MRKARQKDLQPDKAEERAVWRSYDLLHSGKATALQRVFAQLHVWWYTYTVLSGIYMLEWWEICIVQLCLAGVALVACLSLWRAIYVILYVFDYL